MHSLLLQLYDEDDKQLAASGTGNASAISDIFVATNLSAAAGAVTAMFVAWKRYKRPGLSITLNGALAGLVAIIAGCNVISPAGAVAVGIIAGIILASGIEFIDQVLKIDDPMGAISVHGQAGAAGTILVACFQPMAAFSTVEV